MEELYYSHPVQIRYWNENIHNWQVGIAFQDFIISAITGEIVLIYDVLTLAIQDGKTTDEAIVELEWLSLHKAILN